MGGGKEGRRGGGISPLLEGLHTSVKRRVVGRSVGVLRITNERLDGVDHAVDLVVDAAATAPVDETDVEVAGSSQVPQSHGETSLGRQSRAVPIGVGSRGRRLDHGAHRLEQQVEAPLRHAVPSPELPPGLVGAMRFPVNSLVHTARLGREVGGTGAPTRLHQVHCL